MKEKTVCLNTEEISLKPIIRVENLTHTYGENTPFCRSAVKDVSMEIYQGEFLGVIGHTGSGKSTLIQHLNGLLKPTGGRILLGDRDIWAEPKKIRDVRFRVGLVFQYPEYQLFEETAYKDIAFGPKNMGLDEREIDRRVRASAAFAGLEEELLEKSPFDLSGGQKRRVAIAGVIAMEPEVLILDEPSAGLDPAGRRSLLENIRAYHKEKGTTVVMVSHSMDEVAENVDRIVVLADAGVVMSGTPHEVFSRAQELIDVGLNVPQVTQVAMELVRRGVPVDPAVYTVADLRAALSALKGGRARYAEGYHPGPVFPRKFPGSPPGSPDKDPINGSVYCGSFLCQMVCVLRFGGGAAHRGDHGLRRSAPGSGAGIKAHFVHYLLYSGSEPVLYPRRNLGVLLDFQDHKGGHFHRLFHDPAHHHADYGDIPADLHHQSHRTDGRPGDPSGTAEKDPGPGS